MANTYTQINVQVIFSVKGRGNFITSRFRDDLHKYIAAIINKKGNYSLAVNGYKDHVHAFFELNPTKAVSDVVRDIKSNSSRWIDEKQFLPGKFEWQSGFGAFSYSKSQRNNVIQYILNQEKNHKEKTFREEYMALLNKFDIAFDDHYVFEFYDNE